MPLFRWSIPRQQYYKLRPCQHKAKGALFYQVCRLDNLNFFKQCINLFLKKKVPFAKVFPRGSFQRSRERNLTPKQHLRPTPSPQRQILNLWKWLSGRRTHPASEQPWGSSRRPRCRTLSWPWWRASLGWLETSRTTTRSRRLSPERYPGTSWTWISWLFQVLIIKP